MLWELIDRLGGTSLTIRLSGESGVGKDAGARLIQHHYPHQGATYCWYDCQELLALDNPFSASISNGSTRDLGAILASPEYHVLYFKNIEFMPPDLQAGLIRMLEVQFEQATPWILTSSSQPLAPHIESGRLDKDLLALLDTIRIHIPPLRENPDRIPQLLAWYLNRVETHSSNTMPDTQSMKHLTRYRWPGNLRQLQQLARRAVKSANWPRAIRNIETRSIWSDVTIDEMAAFYILSYAEISIQREKVLEGLIATSNAEDIGLLDLAFFNEAVSQIADSISKPDMDKDVHKKE